MPPKKKLTKKEKARLEAEQAEMLRIEMEKEKHKKLEEARQRKQIELEQAKERQKNEIEENRIRRAQLKNSMAFFHKLEKTIGTIKSKEREEYDWEKYMRCNGLPNASKPSDLRKYIHQWKVSIDKQQHDSRNWLLCTNERTILTHDSNIADLSRSTLRKQQGNLGNFYARRAKEVLGILTELENALLDESLSQNTRFDLMLLNMEIRVFLKEFLDTFTYKVLSHIERDMEIDRPGVCKHVYESEVFKNHIWAYSKDAQLSANPKMRIGEQNPHNEIEFGVFDMQILLPSTLILQSSAIRGLWLSYDHLSDYCPSFNPKRPKQGKIDILMQTKKEWRKRKEILRKKLEEYAKEDPLSFLEPQEQEDSVELAVVKKKFHFDVDKVYTEYEDELSKKRRIAIGPKSYGLSDTDVNLRKYRIIGGVYGVDYLETPQQDKRLNARSFIRTIVTPNSLTRKNFYQLYKPPPPVQPGVRRLPEEIEAEMRMVEAALDKLALVTLQLPDSVIWFEPPIVCRWETKDETLESELMESVNAAEPALDVVTSEITPNSTTNPSPSNTPPRIPVAASKLSLGKSIKTTTIREISDFDMHNIPPGIDIQGLIKDFVLPRLPVGFQVSMSNDVSEEMSQEKNSKSESDVEIEEDDDFEKWSLDGNSSDDEDDYDQYVKAMSIDYEKDRVLYLAKPNKETFPAYKVDEKIPSCNSHGSEDFPPRINKDFLDLDEPRELFPRIEFDKVLKFKEFTAVSEDKLQLTHKKNSNRTAKNATASKIKGDSEVASSQKFVEENKTYLFSELLKDLDHLCELQQPKEMPSLILPTDDDDDYDGDGDEPAATDLEIPLEPTEALQSHPSLYPYYQGISFMCQLEAATATAVKQDSAEEGIEFDSDSSEDNVIDDELEEDAEIEGDKNNHGTNNYESTDGKSSNTAYTRGKWSTRDVHDTKFNEDKLSIQFRTGRLGVFGFALNRYSNMPYQTWEIKPDLKNPGTVLFSFTASIVSLDATITPAGYCVNNFQGGSTAAITDLIGRTVTLSELKTTLIYSAVDIFPDDDAFCYTEGSCEKNYVMEMHLYACMSTMALSHNFSWSRWNLLAGSRTAVLLMRELIEGKKVPFHSTLLVTPLKTAIIECTEVSACFNSVPTAGMDYYADLYQLSQVHAQPVSLLKQREMNPLLRDNVAQIMMAIRPLSFC